MSACQTGLSRTLIGMAGEVSWSMKEGSPESDSIAMLDRDECERARVKRDRRYDGRFFSGVRTTRIYCRPVCPVWPAQSRNVEFYATAAAAEAAGFRPCLRCRPETAPFSPAWQGSRTTVHRAMRLIRDGTLDRAGVQDLAARLGVGSRLLDQTRLSMSDVAARAGFASLRRFNAVFAEVYKRTPSEVRRLRFKPA